MALFGTKLPELLETFKDLVLASVETFHEELASKLSTAPDLDVLRQGIRVDRWLEKRLLQVQSRQRDSQKDLSEELGSAVRQEMRSGFEACQAPHIFKGKGCGERIKE